LLPNLKLATGGQYYFDKNTNYNGREKFIDNNSWEISLGAEYGITEKILVSAGYLRFQTGVGAAYQNDINHSLSSNSFGLGGAYIINDMFKINIGGLYTGGVEDTVNRTETSSGINYDTKYGRRNWVFSLGLDIHF
jgi:long-subunit fatty acid transport protein